MASVMFRMRVVLAVVAALAVGCKTSARPQDGTTDSGGPPGPRILTMSSAPAETHVTPSPSTLTLAGFALAHAAWSVSDTAPKELLVPLAFVVYDGKRELLRFEAETQIEAITQGKSAMKGATTKADAWAFVREGALRSPDGGEIDALSMEFWERGMTEPAVLVQRFERVATGHPFRLLDSFVALDSKVLDAAAAKPILQAVEAGALTHAKVAPLWSSWH